MFSFLIPWDTAGIYTASVLGVATLSYAPYAFLLILSPIIAAIYACVGFAQFPAKEEETIEE
jgi:NhaC family Na+:H+ antiporter